MLDNSNDINRWCSLQFFFCVRLSGSIILDLLDYMSKNVPKIEKEIYIDWMRRAQVWHACSICEQQEPWREFQLNLMSGWACCGKERRAQVCKVCSIFEQQEPWRAFQLNLRSYIELLERLTEEKRRCRFYVKITHFHWWSYFFSYLYIRIDCGPVFWVQQRVYIIPQKISWKGVTSRRFLDFVNMSKKVYLVNYSG